MYRLWALSLFEKDKIIDQDASNVSCIKIVDYALVGVDDFNFLGSTFSENRSFEIEVRKGIGNGRTLHSDILERAWIPKLLINNPFC
ncbi:hypothetical protein DPMN_130912 [Dreissena polymorpha]|uniref:Uncharacterized protein n=1 Tax=Dreissena polymorpha TaxID=45954 RepID=A0A9D4H5Y9_DREPO|nr:hypothetical protein DPMN_130912 [Dreissena polymorpha]